MTRNDKVTVSFNKDGTRLVKGASDHETMDPDEKDPQTAKDNMPMSKKQKNGGGNE